MGADHRSDVYRSSSVANASKSKSNAKYRSSSSSSWLQTDPEMRRKKRVAQYKVFTAEGKVKQTVRNGCRWIKEKYLEPRVIPCAIAAATNMSWYALLTNQHSLAQETRPLGFLCEAGTVSKSDEYEVYNLQTSNITALL